MTAAMPAVVECLDEAGDDLFTFLHFPIFVWNFSPSNLELAPISV